MFPLSPAIFQILLYYIYAQLSIKWKNIEAWNSFKDSAVWQAHFAKLKEFTDHIKIHIWEPSPIKLVRPGCGEDDTAVRNPPGADTIIVKRDDLIQVDLMYEITYDKQDKHKRWIVDDATVKMLQADGFLQLWIYAKPLAE